MFIRTLKRLFDHLLGKDLIPNANRSEIDHHTMKLIVGIMAISLAFLTNILSGGGLDSISASYHEGGWARNIFVGFLFTISAFLLSYNGYDVREMLLSKVAAISAIGIAMFPSESEEFPTIVPALHYISAAIMFCILAIFCKFFSKRAKEKKYSQATVRTKIYKGCGIVIILCMVIMALDFLLSKGIRNYITRLIFYGEALSLIAFGIAWLTASLTLPVITHKDERIPLFTSIHSKDKR